MLEGWNNETALHENRSYFPEERKCIVFALQHGGNDVPWIYCLHRDIKPWEECSTPSGSAEATYCCDIVLKVLVLVVMTMNCEIKPHQHDSHKSWRHQIVFFSFWNCGFLLIASLESPVCLVNHTGKSNKQIATDWASKFSILALLFRQTDRHFI